MPQIRRTSNPWPRPRLRRACEVTHTSKNALFFAGAVSHERGTPVPAQLALHRKCSSLHAKTRTAQSGIKFSFLGPGFVLELAGIRLLVVQTKEIQIEDLHTLFEGWWYRFPPIWREYGF